MSNKVSCPKCGASLSEDSYFCNYCGTALVDMQSIIKKRAELAIQKEADDEKFYHHQRMERLQLPRMIMATIFIAIGLGALIFMGIMATIH